MNSSSKRKVFLIGAGPGDPERLKGGDPFVFGRGGEELQALAAGDIELEALARSGTTLVIYMGLRRLQGISFSLIEAGMKPETPACAIENGTLKTQREVFSTLRDLARDVLKREIGGPAIVVIADVVGLSRVLEKEKHHQQAA